MRKLSVVAALLVAALIPAFADDMDDMDDARSPQPPAASDDARFIAYSDSIIAYTHVELIDGTGAAPRYDQTLVIDHGKIAARGPARGTHIPQGAKIIDGRGKTLIPGFVMVHEHLFYPTGKGNYASLIYSFPRLYLAGGTTTARTGGTMNPYGDLELKHAIELGKAIGPDLDVTAPYLNGPGLPILTMHVLTGVDDARRTANYWLDEGATSFKAYTNITREELEAVIEIAHARHIKVTGHLCSVTYREAAELGIDNLEHGFGVMTDFYPGKQPDVCPPKTQTALADVREDDPRVMDLMRFLIAHHVALTSTLTVFETFTPGRPQAPSRALDMLIPELRTAYETRWRDVQTAEANKPYANIFPKLMHWEKMFADMGGLLISGTDPTGYGGVIPGFSGKREVELLVEAGFTFPQALEIATLNGARYLGRDGEVGSLAPGKRADIAVLDGDPMHDSTAIERIHAVFRDGVGYNSDAIFDAIKGTAGLY